MSPLWRDTSAVEWPQWSGFAILGDPLLVEANPMRMLALPNYLIFTLLSTAAIALVAWRAAHSALSGPLIAAIGALYGLEVARWMYSVWCLAILAGNRIFVIEPLTYIILAVLLAPMLFAMRVAYGRIRTAIYEPSGRAPV